LANYADPGWVILWPDKGGSHLRRLDSSGNFIEEDARLIAEAGTVHHECGLSPRELQERCSAMEAALQHCEQMLMKYAIDRVDHEAIEGEALEIIRAALAKHKKV